MPTKQQLFRQWEIDHEFGKIDDHGSEHTPIGELPTKRIPKNNTGEKLGEWQMVDGKMRLITDKSKWKND